MKTYSASILLSLCCASLAYAAGDTATGQQGAGSTSVGKPTEKGAGDAYLAKDFWDKNAKGGYLSKEAVGKFKGADGKSIDMKQIDMDNDGKVSEREWTSYHATAGAAGVGGSTGD